MSVFYKLLASAILIGSVAACNTVEGVGEDVEAAGDAVDQTAEESNPYRNRY